MFTSLTFIHAVVQKCQEEKRDGGFVRLSDDIDAEDPDDVIAGPFEEKGAL